MKSNQNGSHYYNKTNSQFLLTSQRVYHNPSHSQTLRALTQEEQKSLIQSNSKIQTIVQLNQNTPQPHFKPVNHYITSSLSLFSKIEQQTGESPSLFNQNLVRTQTLHKFKTDQNEHKKKIDSRLTHDISHLQDCKINQSGQIKFQKLALNLKPNSQQAQSFNQDTIQSFDKAQTDRVFNNNLKCFSPQIFQNKLKTLSQFKESSSNICYSSSKQNISVQLLEYKQNQFMFLQEDLQKQMGIKQEIPTGRQQAQLLNKWMKKHLKGIESNHFNNLEGLKNIICLSSHELVRQSKVDCAERAEIIQILFSQAISCINNFENELIITKEKKEIEKLDENNRIQHFYEKLMKDDKMQIHMLNEQVNQLNKQNTNYQSIFDNQDQQYENLRAKFAKLQKLSLVLKKKYDQTQIEVERLIINRNKQKDKERNKRNAISNTVQSSSRIRESSNIPENVVGNLQQIISENEQRGRQNTKKSSVNARQSQRGSQMQIRVEEVQKESESESEAEKLNNVDEELLGVLKMDQQNLQELNDLVLNMDKVINIAEKHTEMDKEYLSQFYNSKECQTDLNLLNKKYNFLFFNMASLDQNVEHLQFKITTEKQIKDMEIQIQTNVKSTNKIKQDDSALALKSQSLLDFESEVRDHQLLEHQISILQVENELFQSKIISLQNQLNQQQIIVNQQQQYQQQQSINFQQQSINLNPITNNNEILLNQINNQNFDINTPNLNNNSILNISQNINETKVKSNTAIKDKEKLFNLLKINNSQLEHYKTILLKTQNQVASLQSQQTIFDQQNLMIIQEKNSIEAQKLVLEQTIEEMRIKYHINELEEAEKQKELQMNKKIKDKNNLSKKLSSSAQQAKNLVKSMQAKEFNFGQKVTIEYDFQKNNIGIQIVDRIKKNQYTKLKNFMPLKLVLKQITLIYFDKLDQSKEIAEIQKLDLASFTYQYFMSQFGFKKIADQKFLILMASVKNYMEVIRVNVFAKMVGLVDEHACYSMEDMKKYLEILDFCQVNQQGTTIKDNQSEIKYYVPYIRVVSYIGQFPDSRLSPDENSDLKKDIDSLKENDPKNINKLGIIDFDLLLIKILAKLKTVMDRAKDYVINAFAACDLDGNKMCNFEEWVLLNRHIENDSLAPEILASLFFENADLMDGDDKNMSFEKFAQVSVENNLFTDLAQNNFLGIKHKEQIKLKMDELVEIWQEKMESFEKILDSLTIIEESEISHWREIIEGLDDRISGRIEFAQKPLLIAFRILEKEIELLQESQMCNDLCD